MSIDHIVLFYTILGEVYAAISTNPGFAGRSRSDPGTGGQGHQCTPAHLRLLRKRTADDPAPCALCAGRFLWRQRRLPIGTHRLAIAGGSIRDRPLQGAVKICTVPGGTARAGINPAPTKKSEACRRGGLYGRPWQWRFRKCIYASSLRESCTCWSASAARANSSSSTISSTLHCSPSSR